MCISSRDQWNLTPATMCRSAARVLYEAETLEQQTMHLHKCDHVFFLRGGGGRAINRETAIFVAASPRVIKNPIPSQPYVQLCANSAIYSLHSHLVWTHLKVTKLQKCWKVHLAVVVNICFHRSCGDWVAWAQSDTKTRSCDVFPGRSSYHTQHAGLCPLVQWDRTTTWEQRRVRRPSSRAWCY